MTQAHFYIKAQRDAKIEVGELYIVTEIPVSGTENWESTNRIHEEDPSGDEGRRDYGELVGEEVRIVDTEPQTLWVQIKGQENGKYWDVPFFALERRDIQLRIGPSNHDLSTVIYNSDSIRVGCCRISHEELSEIYKRALGR